MDCRGISQRYVFWPLLPSMHFTDCLLLSRSSSHHIPPSWHLIRPILDNLFPVVNCDYDTVGKEKRIILIFQNCWWNTKMVHHLQCDSEISHKQWPEHKMLIKWISGALWCLLPWPHGNLKKACNIMSTHPHIFTLIWPFPSFCVYLYLFLLMDFVHPLRLRCLAS